MDKNKNIQQIEEMLPDFISGTLNESDRMKVEKALAEYPQLNSIYLDYKKTFEFVSSVKFQEPPAQYWNSLLPRIHEKIDRKKEKLWYPFRNAWKIILPIAALVLIFIVYKTIFSPAPEITKKQAIDSVKTIQPPQEMKVKQPETTEKTITEVKKEEMVKYPKRYVHNEIVPIEKQKIEKIDENQITKEETDNGRDEELTSNEIIYNIASSVDDVEAIYEESEKEYNNLSTAEKSEVLDKLKEIDL